LLESFAAETKRALENLENRMSNMESKVEALQKSREGNRFDSFYEPTSFPLFVDPNSLRMDLRVQKAKGEITKIATTITTATIIITATMIFEMEQVHGNLQWMRW
jgi:hypothetical protein